MPHGSSAGGNRSNCPFLEYDLVVPPSHSYQDDDLDIIIRHREP